MDLCQIEDCNKVICALGYCSMHYGRLIRRGNVNIILTNKDRLPKYNSLNEYINKSYKINTKTNCWEWNKSFKSEGYGNAWWNNKHEIAHRLSWTCYVGEIPQGLNVLHKCDNRKCINPKHLFLGTILDNNRDRKNKGRNANTFGERNPFSKLTEKQVMDILTRLRKKERGSSIAKLYNVSKHAISKIKTGKNWAYLQENKTDKEGE